MGNHVLVDNVTEIHSHPFIFWQLPPLDSPPALFYETVNSFALTPVYIVHIDQPTQLQMAPEQNSFVSAATSKIMTFAYNNMK